ncbi:DUF1549 and DUF1553 domain-containing protein [Verrucomicrobia bacterium]|jgi:hypothetical protein|nr:DUF1549 and DUF1553 domain-containing protein [Verrucomicrobiota bacterium]
MIRTIRELNLSSLKFLVLAVFTNLAVAETIDIPISKTALEIQHIEAYPSELRVGLNETAETIVFSAMDKNGLRFDVTDLIDIELGEWLQRESDGQLTGKTKGTGNLTARMGKHILSIPIEVVPSNQDSPLSFVRDILPILSRAGCNGGSCHAKPNGQNSFALSVFAFDPRSDYHEIVSDARGRRIFPGLPAESLLLQKPTLAVPHKGGKRLEVGSKFYTEITRWIQEGMPYQLKDESNLTEVRISPPEGRFGPNTEHRLRVDAIYEDGSKRDITQMVEYAVSDKELLQATENGEIQFSDQSGQGVVLARYMGHIGQLKVTVPKTLDIEEPIESNFSENNFIDTLAQKHFTDLGLVPSETCTDEEFLRRAFLDAVGRLPSIDETREYLADKRKDKRKRWVDRILKDPLYGDFWANKWADLLRPNPDRVGVKSVFMLDRWLRDQFRANTRYDHFVRSIVGHRGSNHGEGPAVIYRDRRTPTELSSMFSQLFLGVRMECAKCHHHPFEKWSQADFYQFAAYFGSLKQKGAGLSPPISAGTEIFYFSPGGSVKHPVTEESMAPKPPDGPTNSDAEDLDPRQSLADWLTEPGNPYFSRAIVNRIWANFFSRGFVNPVDDFRDSNPPINEPLLDALAVHLVEQEFDLKALMATIMRSSLYQLSAIPNPSNVRDTKNFSRFYRKRLPAETLLDAVCDVTQVAESFDGMPAGMRAMETWTYKIESHFLDAFSRPNSSSDPPNERDDKSSVVQALHMMNSDNLQGKLSHKNGWVTQLAQSEKTSPQIIEELYLATFSRFPSDEERSIAASVLPDDGKDRQIPLEDLLWALINTAEFVFNH